MAPLLDKVTGPMFFPLTFWIKVGELACSPSRKRHLQNPLATLSVTEAEAIVGPKLCAPFQPNPAAIGAYQKAAEIAAALDQHLRPAPELSRLTHQVLQKANNDALKEADAQWAHVEDWLPLLSSLLAVKEWQYPAAIESEMLFPELSHLKKLNFVLQLRAAVLWTSQDFDLALAFCQAAQALANRIQNCGGLFIHELVADSCHNRLCRMIRSALALHQTPELLLANFYSLFEPNGHLPDRLVHLFEREFQFGIVPNLRLRSTPVQPLKNWRDRSEIHLPAAAQFLLVEWSFRNHKQPIHRIQTLREVADIYPRLSAALQEGWPAVALLNQLAEKYGEGIPKPYQSTMLDTLVGVPPTIMLAAPVIFKSMDNPYGRLCLSRLFSISAQLVTAAYKTEAERSATRICIGEARRQAIGAQGPLDSLDILFNAGFLNEIPNDPISGTPFRLDPETQSIWLPGPQNMTFAQANANRKNGAWIWNLPKPRQ